MALVTTTVTIEGGDLGLFLYPLVEYADLTTLGFNIYYGQRDGYMTFHNEKDKLTKKKDTCGYDSPGTGATMSRKLLSPVMLQAYDEQCARTFDDTIMAEMRKTGVMANDLTGTQVMDFLLYLFRPTVARDMKRIMLLADTALVGDTDYNQIDGWYKKLKAQIPAAQDIGAIASVTSSNVLTYLQDAYLTQTLRLKQVPANQKAFYVTRSVFEAYQMHLISNTSLESARAELINGNIPTTYLGIQLIVLDIVDQYVADVDPSGSSGISDTPNRIVLAKKSETGVMIDSPSAGVEFQAWYDINTDLNKFLARYRMDIQIGYTDYFVIGGF